MESGQRQHLTLPASLGVADGTRTRDSQDHNLVLYQLNYSHHRRRAVKHVRPVDISR